MPMIRLLHFQRIDPAMFGMGSDESYETDQLPAVGTHDLTVPVAAGIAR